MWDIVSQQHCDEVDILAIVSVDKRRELFSLWSSHKRYQNILTLLTMILPTVTCLPSFNLLPKRGPYSTLKYAFIGVKDPSHPSSLGFGKNIYSLPLAAANVLSGGQRTQTFLVYILSWDLNSTKPVGFNVKYLILSFWIHIYLRFHWAIWEGFHTAFLKFVSVFRYI